MTAINHALTGAAIGLIIGEPLVAVPAALTSHYVCDALPHFGFNLRAPAKRKAISTNGFRNYLLAEAALCLALVVVLALLKPQNWLLAAVCAFLAAAPDLFSVKRYLAIRHGRYWRPNLYSRFASNIQWFERPIGAAVEAAWLIAALVILLPFVGT